MLYIKCALQYKGIFMRNNLHAVVLFQTVIKLNTSSGSDSITHVISENNCIDEVRTWLESHSKGQSLQPAHLLDISWYTESMRAGHPVEVLERHKLQVHFTMQMKSNDFGKCGICEGRMGCHLQFIYFRLVGVFQEQQLNESGDVVFSVPGYACQRRTTLENHNTILTVCPSGYTHHTDQCYLYNLFSVFYVRRLCHFWQKMLS